MTAEKKSLLKNEAAVSDYRLYLDGVQSRIVRDIRARVPGIVVGRS